MPHGWWVGSVVSENVWVVRGCARQAGCSRVPHGLGEWHGRGGMGAGDKSSCLSSLTAWALWQELFFILSSIWQHRFYYMFGFLVLVFLVSLCLPGGGGVVGGAGLLFGTCLVGG